MLYLLVPCVSQINPRALATGGHEEGVKGQSRLICPSQAEKTVELLSCLDHDFFTSVNPTRFFFKNYTEVVAPVLASRLRYR